MRVMRSASRISLSLDVRCRTLASDRPSLATIMQSVALQVATHTIILPIMMFGCLLTPSSVMTGCGKHAHPCPDHEIKCRTRHTLPMSLTSHCMFSRYSSLVHLRRLLVSSCFPDSSDMVCPVPRADVPGGRKRRQRRAMPGIMVLQADDRHDT